MLTNKAKTVILVSATLAMFSCSNSSDPSTPTNSSEFEPSNQVADTTNQNSEEPVDGSTVDNQGAGTCNPLRNVVAGDKALYKVSYNGGVERDLLVEVIDQNSNQIRFTVSENGAVFEVRTLSGCREFTPDEIADSNTNINGYSGNIALQQILEGSRFATSSVRALDDLVLESTNCLEFSTYEEIENISFEVETCRINYLSQNIEGGSIEVITDLSNFDLTDDYWIVEQEHKLMSGEATLSMNLIDVKVTGQDGSIDTF